MSNITAILQPDADGTLHLPLPRELRAGMIRVDAKLEPVDEASATSIERLGGFGAFEGKIWMSPDFDDPLDEI